MSFVSRLINPNPPLTADQVQAAVVAALAASPPSPIRSIQRGTFTIPAQTGTSTTVTISSVTLGKSSSNLLNLSSFGHGEFVYLRLTAATQLTFYYPDQEISGAVISYEVIEYM